MPNKQTTGDDVAHQFSPFNTPPRQTTLNLTVSLKNREIQRLIPAKSSITIGRAPENDITLSHEDVSRCHVNLEQVDDAWLIQDLDSMNGTLLDNTPLSPGEKVLWPADKPLKIGEYILFWEVSEQDVTETQSIADVPIDALDAEEDALNEWRSLATPLPAIDISLSTPQIEVALGGKSVLNMTVVNRGGTTEHCNVSVRSLSKRWYTLSQNTLTLGPKESQVVQMVIHPPEKIDLNHKLFLFQIVLGTLTDNRTISHCGGQLTVRAFNDFALNVWPPIVLSGETCHLEITNRGDGDETYLIRCIDRNQVINFSQHQWRFHLASGKRHLISFSPMLDRQPPWFGLPIAASFELHADSSNQKHRLSMVQVIVPPRFPTWIVGATIGIASLMAIMLLILLVLLDLLA